MTERLIDKAASGCENNAAGRWLKEQQGRREDVLVELLGLVQKYGPEAQSRARRL
jgi:carnitine 3-dehydrogenase